MTASFTCEVLTSAAAIAPIAEEWEDLHRRCGNGLFVGPEFLGLWWETLGQKQKWKPYMVTVRQDGRLVGTLGLAVRRYCCLRILEWAGNDLFDYRDVLAETPEVVRALWDCARRSAGFDVASIRDVRVDSLSYPVLAETAKKSRVRQAFGIKMDRPPGADWTHVLSKKQRRNFTRQRKRLEQAGSVQFEIVQRAPVPEAAVSSLVEQKLAWCRRRKSYGIFREENIKDIFLRLTTMAAEQGQLYLGTLKCAGKPVAHIMGFIDRGILYSYTKTYDEEWADYSPGLQALVETIKWAAENDIHEYDFMRGEEDYKQRFANNANELNSFVFSRTFCGWWCAEALLLCRRMQRFVKDGRAWLQSARNLSAASSHEGERDPSEEQGKSGFWETLRQDVMAMPESADDRKGRWLVAKHILGRRLLPVFLYRLSALCWRNGGWQKKLARILWRLNVFINACDIDPAASIGGGLCLPP
ncbi:MAG: GNAT family N-acetyltransferase, partial [Alphaproteobacteria bacterium]|nr:GNAT family N-acetyltransferase [Alphaproteobacteria bacterium]